MAEQKNCESFVCEKCKVIINENKKKYVKHFDDNKYSCKMCNELFPTKPNLKIHINECYGDIHCPSCELLFSPLDQIYKIKDHISDCVLNKGDENKMDDFISNFEEFLLSVRIRENLK